MVALDKVLAENEQEAKLDRALWHMGRSDESLLREMIENHVKLTGSKRAEVILANWSEAREQFVKVFPNEYRRALTEMAAKNSKLAA
jgi:glutamate synthase domain-containing protein 3